MSFIRRNDLKITQFKLFSFFYFKSVIFNAEGADALSSVREQKTKYPM